MLILLIVYKRVEACQWLYSALRETLNCLGTFLKLSAYSYSTSGSSEGDGGGRVGDENDDEDDVDEDNCSIPSLLTLHDGGRSG